MTDFIIRNQKVGKWTMPTVVFKSEDNFIAFEVNGIIGNSVPTSNSGKQKTVKWKRLVARAAKAARGELLLDPSWLYSISAGFSFNLRLHGGPKSDVENFLKPTFDALAAGLFCTVEQDTDKIVRYDYDDSNFKFLFVYKLDDAQTADDEGVGITISIRKL